MRKPSCFAARDAMRPQAVSPAVAPDPCPPAPVLPVAKKPFGLDPVLELLESLRGQEVVLQVGDVCRKGRIVVLDPLMIVGHDGKTTLIRLEAIQAVEF